MKSLSIVNFQLKISSQIIDEHGESILKENSSLRSKFRTTSELKTSSEMNIYHELNEFIWRYETIVL